MMMEEIQRVRDVPKSNQVLSLVFMSDVLNTIIRSAIGLFGNSLLAGIFIILLYVTLISFCFVVFICLCVRIESETAIAIFFVEILGAIFYLYGDNITYIIQQYGEAFRCGQRCVENVELSAVFFLALALVCFHFLSLYVTKNFYMHTGDVDKNNDNSEKWKYASDMISIIPKVDVLFTEVTLIGSMRCTEADQGITATLLVIFVLAGIFVMFIRFFFYYEETGFGLCENCQGVSFLLIIIALPMYMLADNRTPLDCAFQCDSSSVNVTQNVISCISVVNSGTRLGLALPSFILILAFLLLLKV